MGCYNPQIGYPLPGLLTPAGKQQYRFIRADRGVPLKFEDRRFYSAHREECVFLPCNTCLGCRLKYAQQWAARCMYEAQYHDQSWFVTLTYNDDHVPKSYFDHPETGDKMPSLTLDRRDIQLFLKRLRLAKSGDTIRYYGCGEYGPTTWRPHYHIILFGLHLDDLQIKSQNVDGTVNSYVSPTLQAAWSLRPFGNMSPVLDAIGEVECSPVSYATCAYTARYVVKKQLGPDGRDFYERFALKPPFTFMSLKPGIGAQYYRDHPEMYQWDSIDLPVPQGSLKLRPPRYFDRLYDIDYPDDLQVIKDSRRLLAEAAQQAELANTSLSLYELLALKERQAQKKGQKEFDI